ncbi:uncharacterized protein [Aegilops tauschii subsp. strangulata]|nr:uncharacterized protein LOC109785660 [Aegilops tauschii subsp. strangulata]
MGSLGKSGKRRTRCLPAATALASTITTSSSSSSTNPEETTSPSPYFLPELIPLIASRLTTLEDIFALRAACRAYRARLPLSSSTLASQGPLLLVQHKTSAALFHVPLRRILRFRLPRARLAHGIRPTCFGRLFTPQVRSLTCFHSFGCRVAIQGMSAGASRPELRIRHLLTGERARLPDPPKCVGGILFSNDLILAFTPWHRDIYYCRIGDAQWQAARCDEGYNLHSLMFVKDTLYALIYPNYRLAVVDLDNNSVVLSFLGDELSAHTVPDGNLADWLAECHGELLLIIRRRLYRVFQWQSKERKWARTHSLGGCSLFFNMHEFAGCLGPDHPGVRRDCLYFTGSFGNWSEYSLVDRSLNEIVAEYPGQSVSKDFVSLAWVLPSIC